MKAVEGWKEVVVSGRGHHAPGLAVLLRLDQVLSRGWFTPHGAGGPYPPHMQGNQGSEVFNNMARGELGRRVYPAVPSEHCFTRKSAWLGQSCPSWSREVIIEK